MFIFFDLDTARWTTWPSGTGLELSITRLVCSVTRLGKFLKPLATINLPKSHTFLGNFCECVKIYHFYSEIIFGQLL